MIKQVRIQNFKSLLDVTVHFEPLTVLIGRSGTGKTNFVEGLRFLRDFLKARNFDPAVARLGGWQNIMPFRWRGPTNLSFEVTFSIPGYSKDYLYLVVFSQHANAQRSTGPNFREEKLVLGDDIIFHQVENKWLVPPKLDSLPALSGIMLGGLTGLTESSYTYLVLTDGIGCYSFPDQVLVDAPTHRNQSGFSDSGDNILEAIGQITKTPQAWTNLSQIASALRLMDPMLRSVDLAMPQRDRVVLSHLVEDKVFPIDLVGKSEGFRRFFAHLLALYQTPSKHTLVFEEPEKGIHPGALEALADQFKACPEAGRGQVILTTHSPELLNHFEPEQLRVVDISDFASAIGPVAKDQIESIREDLMRPGELLTVDRARLQGASAS